MLSLHFKDRKFSLGFDFIPKVVINYHRGGRLLIHVISGGRRFHTPFDRGVHRFHTPFDRGVIYSRSIPYHLLVAPTVIINDRPLNDTC